MAISECPECESTDLAGYDDENPARMQCRDCATKMEPCTMDGCNGIRILVATDYMNQWECTDDDDHDIIYESQD